MSSGVQRLLIKGGGDAGHTPLLVHAAGQLGTFPPSAPKEASPRAHQGLTGAKGGEQRGDGTPEGGRGE